MKQEKPKEGAQNQSKEDIMKLIKKATGAAMVFTQTTGGMNNKFEENLQ